MSEVKSPHSFKTSPLPLLFSVTLTILGGLKQKLLSLFIHFFFPNSSLTGTAECVNLKGVVRLDFSKPLTLNLDFFW